MNSLTWNDVHVAVGQLDLHTFCDDLFHSLMIHITLPLLERSEN